jgi:hypothetical protein
MKYSIAKLPIKSSKSNARRSYDTRRTCYDVNCIETGCTKIDQMIQCMYDIVSNYTNRVEIIYDAPTDILDLTVKLNGNIQYKFEFHLTVDNDKLGYNIKVDNINWTKVVKDAKLFNPHIAAQGDTLTVADTNHAELKLLVNAVKRHYSKYNLCKHYESMVNPACATIEHEIDDAVLINMIDKHANDITLKRVKAFCKKYSIKAMAEIRCTTVNMRRLSTEINTCKLSDGNFIVCVEVVASYKKDDFHRRDCPCFYITYYINNKTGKITWLFSDDKMNANWWYSNTIHNSDDKVKLDIEIEQVGDWKLDKKATSYDDWFAKFALVEYVNDEVVKLIANIKAERGL